MTDEATQTPVIEPAASVETDAPQIADAGLPPPPPQGPSRLRDLADTQDEFTRKLIAALKTVYDPEIPVDIFELGLIYKIDVAENKDVAVEMTLTAPGCPIAGEMPLMVEEAIKTVEGIGAVTVNMTFDPPWSMEMMSEEARVSLDMF